MTQVLNAPVITIDGPVGSGKGTIARSVANALGWHLLDSGALYRLVSLAALNRDVSLDDVDGLSQLAAGLDARFGMQPVRDALLGLQKGFRQAPGLVADGRDMGTHVFAEAGLKVFLTASPEERAKRRHKQLKDKGIDVSLAALSRDIEERDRRDSERSVAPLRPAEDARLLDSSGKSIEEVVRTVLDWAAEL